MNISMKKTASVEMVKTSLKLPALLWKEAHIRASNEGKEFQEIVADALESYVGISGVLNLRSNREASSYKASFQPTPIGYHPPCRDDGTCFNQISLSNAEASALVGDSILSAARMDGHSAKSVSLDISSHNRFCDRTRKSGGKR